MSIIQVQKRLDAIDMIRWEAIDEVVSQVRENKLIPYCDNHSLRFIAGMGVFAFHNSKGILDDCDISKHLINILMVNLTPSHTVGSVMEDYTSKGYAVHML